MQEELIKWAINNKFRIFDFTIGNEPYKKIWTNDVIKIFFHIKLISIRGLLFIMVFNFSKLIKQNKSLRRFFMTITSSNKKRPKMNIALTLHRVVKSEKIPLKS